MELKCPYCGGIGETEEAVAEGDKVECPFCGQKYVIKGRRDAPTRIELPQSRQLKNSKQRKADETGKRKSVLRCIVAGVDLLVVAGTISFFVVREVAGTETGHTDDKEAEGARERPERQDERGDPRWDSRVVFPDAKTLTGKERLIRCCCANPLNVFRLGEPPFHPVPDDEILEYAFCQSGGEGADPWNGFGAVSLRYHKGMLCHISFHRNQDLRNTGAKDVDSLIRKSDGYVDSIVAELTRIYTPIRLSVSRNDSGFKFATAKSMSDENGRVVITLISDGNRYKGRNVRPAAYTTDLTLRIHAIDLAEDSEEAQKMVW